MRTAIVLVVLGVASVAAAATRAPQAAPETPRATDLLRAEQRAEEARERLRLPPPRKVAPWERGGSGWGAGRRRPGGTAR